MLLYCGVHLPFSCFGADTQWKQLPWGLWVWGLQLSITFSFPSIHIQPFHFNGVFTCGACCLWQLHYQADAWWKQPSWGLLAYSLQMFTTASQFSHHECTIIRMHNSNPYKCLRLHGYTESANDLFISLSLLGTGSAPIPINSEISLRSPIKFSKSL